MDLAEPGEHHEGEEPPMAVDDRVKRINQVCRMSGGFGGVEVGGVEVGV